MRSGRENGPSARCPAVPDDCLAVFVRRYWARIAIRGLAAQPHVRLRRIVDFQLASWLGWSRCIVVCCLMWVDCFMFCLTVDVGLCRNGASPPVNPRPIRQTGTRRHPGRKRPNLQTNPAVRSRIHNTPMVGVPGRTARLPPSRGPVAT